MKYLFLFLTSLAFAQQNTPSQIKEVTVYLQGARITRTATVKVKKGANTIKLNNLSASIDESSIMLTDLAGMSLSGLNYTTSILEKETSSERLKNINSRLDSVANVKIQIDAQVDGLKEERALLQNNRILNTGETSISLAKVKEFGSYYNERISAISMRLAQLNQDLTDLNQLSQKLNQGKSQINPEMNELKGTITLNVTSNVSKTVKLELKYNVSNAGWVPVYDITAEDASSDVNLKFKGQVYQSTGIEWDQVKMILSTGDPFMDNTKPTLEAKRLNFVRRGYRNSAVGRSNKRYNPNVRRVTGIVTDPSGEPILGATVQERGTNNTTTTNFNGRYSININSGTELFYNALGYDLFTESIYSSRMDVQLSQASNELDEVVIQAYSNSSRNRTDHDDLDDKAYEAPTPQNVEYVEENVSSRSYELVQPYSILSTGETTDIEISSNNLEADFEYYAAPVINENVFLTVQLKNWESLNLIPGEANVYFEDAYNGKIYFDTDTTDKSLTVSLGVDPQISVKREDVRDLKEKSFFGDKRILNKKYEITIKNNRKKPIDLKLQDRIPLTSNSDIKVDEEEPGDAEMNKETQILTWQISLASGAQVKKTFSYEVKYPKNKRINLD
ncbi:hypothetical protein BST97_03825 [Nonlabens spongiae]|uniref:Mucoidy inhibitor MuiA family protein n=1 Tax=Nonlabens spongiae TaxID=331648 RepID=A0A1W6MHW5_9FLAO|nr:mucoidy inhibitor MuiA family protein [Nonlabens spongiae]ARN77182.1 hypothetical protein BST97_03825 [Nonlabens spongiae]